MNKNDTVEEHEEHEEQRIYRPAHPQRKLKQWKNIAMAWIEYKKVYPTVLQIWIIASENVQNIR